MAHRLSPEAEADLDEIWFYIATNGTVDAADRFVDALTRRFFLLASHMRAGRARDELEAGLRAFPVGDYLVLYRIEGDDVLIVRVVRGSRDLDPLFDEES
jgi:toxin ParE1/3/4